jgi:hypothetical protein
VADTPFRDRGAVDIDQSFLIISASSGMDTAAVNKYRQGVNVRDFSDFACILSPWLSDRGFPHSTRSRFDPTIETNHFGQPKLFEDPSPALKPGFSSGPGPAPFDDIQGIMNPVAYLEDPGTQRYPVVLLSPNWLDPARMDSIIEPLSIRESLTNGSIGGPVLAHSIKAAMMPTVGANLLGKSTVITRFIPFYDAHDEGIPPFLDDQNISISEGGFEIQAEGYSDEEPHTIMPFDDTPPRARARISPKTLQPPNLSRGSFIDDPRLGIFGKSATVGMIYRGGNYVIDQIGTGNQWVNGTDSIAFGGLLK